ncbi:MAG: acetoacetate decarboxylase family protein [Nevskia sp.]|nr:acetoacetate decarboxylase family protein [Nevskia sp.]
MLHPHIPSFPFDTPHRTRLGLVGSLWSLLRGRIPMWENGQVICIEIPLDPTAAARLLPHGLRLDKTCSGIFGIADYAKTAFTSPYRECFVLFRVRSLLGGAGLHCPWMIVNDDTALIYGRELLAYPKKMGDIAITGTEREISFAAQRRGVALAEGSVSLLEKEENPQPLTGVKIFNTGGPGQFMALNPVWMFRFRETIHESYRAQARLKLADSPYDPVRRLAGNLDQPLAARVGRIDIMGWRYMLPVGLAGPRNFANTFEYRFR